MGLMDKFKKILFDEDEVEVPISNNELPKKDIVKEEYKKEDTIVEKKGFIDYHSKDDTDIDTEEIDPIKEVVLPKEEVKPVTEKRFNFPMEFDDFDTIPNIPTRSGIYNEVKEEKKETKPFNAFEHFEEPKKKNEPRDYKKLLSEREEAKPKKPFKVTPIISPVYGILDKNYKPEEVIEKNPVETVEKKVRDFGPVSFNDEPIPTKVIEVNITTEEPAVDETSIKEVTPEVSVLDEINSIDDDIVVNNNIEDAFESTSEFDAVREQDMLNNEEPSIVDEIIDDDPIIQTEDYEDTKNLDEVIPSKVTIEDEEEVADDEHLDETIETDLFNLIDSMYNSDDDDDNSEDDE